MESHESLKSLYVKLVASLNCGICHDVLTDARDLSCGHTYCLACLQEYVAIKGWTTTIECCQCRKETAFPASGGLKGLKQNYKLNCILEEQGAIFKKICSAPTASAAASPEDVARAQEPEVQVFVRDFEGRSQAVMVRLSDDVNALKRQVERKTGVPPNVQRLTFQSRQLSGEKTLGEFGLKLHSTLEMLLPLMGGA